MKIICDCGAELENASEGVNGSDYFECRCGKAYNVVYSYAQTQEIQDND